MKWTEGDDGMNTANLFSPFQLGSLTLPNRVIMAPLTRCRAGQGTVPTVLFAIYYAQRASAGLIISEATQVSPQGQGYPRTPGIHTSEQVAEWKRVTEAVHVAGGRIFLQLWHVGRISHPSLQPDGGLPVAPSAIAPSFGKAYTYEGEKPYVVPRALKTDEISGIVEQYRQGAENAKAAGFDGVEIHGAFGYLLDQFLQDNSNHRTDRYGGSVENRARLLLEVTEAVVSVWGSGRVGIKLGPSNTYNDMLDSDPVKTFSYVVGALNRFDLAYVQIMEASEADLRHGGRKIPTSIFRDLYKGTLMVNGGYDKTRANAVLAEGAADLVSFGTMFISNPDLPIRLLLDAPLTPANAATYYPSFEPVLEGCPDSGGYTDYPYMVTERMLKPVLQP
jgi:N-ethylmaleimide reductase